MKIEFNLLSNAENSIQRAIELVAWGDDQSEARRLKQAVQSIAHGDDVFEFGQGHGGIVRGFGEEDNGRVRNIKVAMKS